MFINSDRIINYTKFDATMRLAQPKPVTSCNLLTAHQLFHVGDYFIILDFKAADGYFFQVFNNEMTYLSHFAGKGKGPGEFIAPSFSGSYYIDPNKKIYLWIFDTNLGKAFKIDLIKAIENKGKGESYIVSFFELPKNHLLISELHYFEKENTAFARCDVNSNGLFLLFHPNSKQPYKWIEQDNFLNTKIDSAYRGWAYMSTSRIDYKENLIISGMVFYEKLSFINAIGQTILQSINTNNSKSLRSDFNQKTLNSFITYHSGMDLSENYVFVSGSRLTGTQWYKTDNEDKTKMYIDVYSKEGKPLIQFICPGRFVSFCVDLKKSKIFAINNSKEDFVLWEYDIPTYLK